MSTAKIREALWDMMTNGAGPQPSMARAALAEEMAIEKAALEIVASDALEDWGPKAPDALRDAFRIIHALAWNAAQRNGGTTGVKDAGASGAQE